MPPWQKLAWPIIGAAVVTAGAISASSSNGDDAGARAAPPVVLRRISYSPGRYPALTLPDGQAREVRSLLNVTRPMQFGDYAWDEGRVPAGAVWIRIDLARQTLSVFRAGEEIGSAVILYGTDGRPTPRGVFRILERATRHRSSAYDAEMPYMLRLTQDGVAIHASNVRRGAATHGCIGVPLGFARRLYGQVRRGDLVAIVADAPSGERMAARTPGRPFVSAARRLTG